MIDLVRAGIAWVLLAAGSGFLLIGALGLKRMPDAFARMHAASLIDTTGAGLMLIGLMVVSGWSLVTLKLAVLVGLIWFLGPVATHAIARAAHQAHLGDSRPADEPGRAPSKR